MVNVLILKRANRSFLSTIKAIDIYLIMFYNIIIQEEQTMSLCPICKFIMCDHTPEERRQSPEETHRPPTEEEVKKSATRIVINGIIYLAFCGNPTVTFKK